MNNYNQYYCDYLGIESSDICEGSVVVKSNYRDIPLNRKFLYPIIFANYKENNICSVSYKKHTICSRYYDGTKESIDTILSVLNRDVKQYDIRTFRRYSIDKPIQVNNRINQVLTEDLIRALKLSPEIDVDAFIKRKSSAIEEKNQYIITVDNEIASTAYISNKEGNGCNIVVYTNPKYRNKGYGKSVVVECINWILSNEMVPVYLVEESNLPSIALAESLGMVCKSREWIVTDRLYNF